MPVLTPDRRLPRCTALDVRADLLDAGFTHLLLDVDNTILPRDGSGIPEDVRAWIGEVRKAGVRICLMSNNWHEPVIACARELDLPLVKGCVKPLPHGFIRARRRIGGVRRHTIVVGDQLVTDVWGAHLAGLSAVLVPPLVQQDLWHTRALRHIERAILSTDNRH